MAVKVILRQDVPNLGQSGDIKQVANGYFRNFLQPRGLAVEASRGQVASLQASSAVRAGQAARQREQVDALAVQLAGITLRIPVRVGEQGRIYGSVTNRDVAEALQAQASVTVDRQRIDLPEALKTVGVHSVPIKLESGVAASVQVELVPDYEAAQS